MTHAAGTYAELGAEVAALKQALEKLLAQSANA